MAKKKRKKEIIYVGLWGIHYHYVRERVRNLGFVEIDFALKKMEYIKTKNKNKK
jgi:hypothetical protein